MSESHRSSISSLAHVAVVVVAALHACEVVASPQAPQAVPRHESFADPQRRLASVAAVACEFPSLAAFPYADSTLDSMAAGAR